MHDEPMAERLTTAQVFIAVRLAITHPDPSLHPGRRANALAGLLPSLRFPLPVFSRLGGCSRCAPGTRLLHIILLVAESYDFNGRASAAVVAGWRGRPSYPQHRVHKNPCKPAVLFPIDSNPGMHLAEDEVAVSRLHVVRRRLGA